MNQYLVVGTGNIAKRHIANLRLIFPECEIVCASSTGRFFHPDEVGADQAIFHLKDITERSFNFAIVASPASLHMEHARVLLTKNIPTLIEKPLFDSMENFSANEEIFCSKAQIMDVGYNFRFYPSAQKMKKLLEEQIVGEIYSVHIDVGQYLPSWRPGSNYKEGVSARKHLGGGVILELSHELDYLIWLFGHFDSVFCVARNTGALEIDVEDCVTAILYKQNGLTATLTMDFLQKTASRTCKVIGQHGTIKWDLIKNSIELTANNVDKILYTPFSYERNQMYIDELLYFEKVSKAELAPLVGLNHGLYIMHIIDALKKSSMLGQVQNLV